MCRTSTVSEDKGGTVGAAVGIRVLFKVLRTIFIELESINMTPFLT